MSNLSDYKSEIDNWADMWDEMQDKKMHPALEKPEQSAFASKILGDEPQDSHYDDVDPDGLLQESEEATQNPVRMDTVGPDQDQPNPAWVKEDFLSEIEDLKQRLFKVENEIARMGQGKKFSETPVQSDRNNFMSKVESLKKQIEKLSSNLGVENDPTPFVIKKTKSS